MKPATFLILILIVLTFGNQALAQKNSRLSELSWMAGHWTSEVNGTLMEEFWLPPSGNMMIGIHRDTFSSGKAFFEYLRIEKTDQGISYLASPGGQPPTEFKLKETDGQRVVFENPEHDFPQRIIYFLKEGNILVARIEGEVNGETRSQQWEWLRKR